MWSLYSVFFELSARLAGGSAMVGWQLAGMQSPRPPRLPLKLTIHLAPGVRPPVIAGSNQGRWPCSSCL